MRWLISALLAMCLSTGAVLSIALFVVSEIALSEQSADSKAQYYGEDYSYVEPSQVRPLHSSG